jgi:hypothetical protein
MNEKDRKTSVFGSHRGSTTSIRRLKTRAGLIEPLIRDALAVSKENIIPNPTE